MSVAAKDGAELELFVRDALLLASNRLVKSMPAKPPRCCPACRDKRAGVLWAARQIAAAKVTYLDHSGSIDVTISMSPSRRSPRSQEGGAMSEHERVVERVIEAIDRVVPREAHGLDVRRVAEAVVHELADIVHGYAECVYDEPRLCHESNTSHDERWCGRCRDLRDGVDLLWTRLGRLLEGTT